MSDMSTWPMLRYLRKPQFMWHLSRYFNVMGENKLIITRFIILDAFPTFCFVVLSFNLHHFPKVYHISNLHRYIDSFVKCHTILFLCSESILDPAAAPSPLQFNNPFDSVITHIPVYSLHSKCISFLILQASSRILTAPCSGRPVLILYKN